MNHKEIVLAMNFYDNAPSWFIFNGFIVPSITKLYIRSYKIMELEKIVMMDTSNVGDVSLAGW